MGVHLIFIASQWQSASWQPSFPEVCPFHCLDAPAEQNGIPSSELRSLLEELAPTVVVVGGYAQRAIREVMAWCRERGVGYCLRSDSSIWDRSPQGMGPSTPCVGSACRDA